MKSHIFALVMVVMAISLSACSNGRSAGTTIASNEWTWVNGAEVVNQRGTYGTLGTPADSTSPGARKNPVSWTDKSGNFWVFGGYGYDSAGNFNLLNDLWQYSAGQWTWMSGFTGGGGLGTYGRQGIGALTNVPGARSGSVTWTDAAGNLWLFGGYGYGGSAASVGPLNDLWEFIPAPPFMPGTIYVPGQWIWMDGSSLTNQPGAYGTPGMAAPGNVPGGRNGAVRWTDASGNFWLFGGNGYDSGGTFGNLNDLWEFSAGEWTWMSGSELANQQGSYGTQGTAAPGNVPGARSGAISWLDSSGNFFLFGGSASQPDNLNDLWEYSAGEWTWVSGSSAANQQGTYGTLGTAAAGNVPGARNGSVSWIDASGDLWLLGGFGYDSAGNSGWLNDLWEYSGGEWTWMGGSDVNGQMGMYGSEGLASLSNVTGARALGTGWTDASGNFWLFGGIGYDWVGAKGVLNDVWQYKP